MNSTQVKRGNDAKWETWAFENAFSPRLLSSFSECWKLLAISWRFILRATCATGYIFSTSSSRDKFLTVKHLSPYRHMLHLYLESFPDIFQENKNERPGPNLTIFTEDRKLYRSYIVILKKLIRVLCNLFKHRGVSSTKKLF